MIAGVGLFKDMNIFQNKEQIRTFCLQIKTTSYPEKTRTSKETGLELIERLRFLASLPLAGTEQEEGGGIRVA